MRSFFNKGFFTQYATVFLTGLLLWLPSAFMQPTMATPDGDFGALLGFIHFSTINIHPVVAVVSAFLLVFITGLFVNRLANDYGLSGKTSTLPLLFFVLLTGFSPSFHQWSASLLALPLITLLFILLFKHYHGENNLFLSFDAGFVTGLLTLIYPPLALLIIVVLISLLSFKGVSWRNFIISLVGLLFPPFLVYAYYFFTGSEAYFLNLFHIHIGLIFNRFYLSLSFNSVLLWLSIILLFISAVKVLQQQSNLSIQQRSYFSIIGISLLMLLFVQLLLSSQAETALLLAPAGALTMGNLMDNTTLKAKWISTAIFIIILSSIVNAYLPFAHVIK